MGQDSRGSRRHRRDPVGGEREVLSGSDEDVYSSPLTPPRAGKSPTDRARGGSGLLNDAGQSGAFGSISPPVFLPACQRAEVRPIRVHDLRHTCASLLTGNGASPKTVQTWLRHTDFKMKMNAYAHAHNTDLHEAALLL